MNNRKMIENAVATSARTVGGTEERGEGGEKRKKIDREGYERSEKWGGRGRGREEGERGERERGEGEKEREETWMEMEKVRRKEGEGGTEGDAERKGGRG